MNKLNFTPRKGILANGKAFARDTIAASAYAANNALRFAEFANQGISDALISANVLREEGMTKFAELLSEQLGRVITVKDLRKGNLDKIIAKSSEMDLALAAKKGQIKLAKKAIKTQKKMEKLNEELLRLKEKQKNSTIKLVE